MKRPIIVAEFTINHLGMRKIVLATLQRCKEMGVDYAKFKKKDVYKYYSKDGKRFNGYDFLLYRNSLELSDEDFFAIDEWCKANDMKWYATCHDLDSTKFISQFDPPYYKIASMDAQNDTLLENLLQHNETKKPMIVSMGGLSMKAIAKIVEKVRLKDIELIILHTVSIYPTPIERCNVSAIAELRQEFEGNGVSIGYSGHEQGYIPTLLAVQHGAAMVERHITLSRKFNIHHINTALTTDEFYQMIKDIDQVVNMMAMEKTVFYEEEFKFLKDRDYS